MAMIDKQLMFSDAQAPTTGTTVSTNSIDTGAAGTIPYLGGTALNDPGRGRPLTVVCQCVVTCTSGGANTTKVQTISSATGTTLGTPTVHSSSEAIGYATIVAGYRFRGLQFGPGVALRYLGVQYVIATADLTAGSFDAWLALDAQDVLI